MVQFSFKYSSSSMHQQAHLHQTEEHHAPCTMHQLTRSQKCTSPIWSSMGGVVELFGTKSASFRDSHEGPGMALAYPGGHE